ncbi:DcaP family trimeric outer membrane transporter [Adhaeribacter terreus]|uniref:DcaP family trimeric outer membrane transporter n=1 Tax=Adhaeribacter terreus TaxID=529703 RepID=A0ABW0EBC3_9BACT
MKRINTLLVVITSLFALQATAQEVEPQPEKRVSMEIYGFTMMDAGYDFKQVHPDWFDVVRPTKLPSFKDEFGEDGETYFSVRQSRLGVKGYLPTRFGELKTTFEFEMFGTGVDAGQTTIRLRHAYGELGKWGAGQYWSPFMDIDVFPNTVEYWGPNGMVFFRNVQIRYMPIQGDTRLTFALERPGASADQGIYADRIELAGIVPQFQLPDLSAEYRYGKKWGYVELAGIVRRIEWVDKDTISLDFSGDATGWGLNLSSGIKFFKKDILHLSVVYGEGIQNYMNDAPVDIGIQNQFDNPNQPIKGVALPLLGIVAFYDRYWSDKFSSSVGYSMLDIDNSDGQAASAFKKGQYAIGNIIYYPTANALMALEYQWGSRDNFKDGWNSTDSRIQLTFKYNFSHKLYAETTPE